MSSNKNIEALTTPPSGMVTKILGMEELGKMIAANAGLESGKYDLVIEYKIGSTKLKAQSSDPIPAMGVGFGGLGLKKSEQDGFLTFEYKKARKSSKPTTKP